MYCKSLIQYTRRRTSAVQVGTLMIGSDYPVRLQSMTTTNTLDIEATVQQCMRIADAGAHLVRITAQGVREAEALKTIKEQLRQGGYDIPLVADIHFNPSAAEVAARYVEKVRINPGNFVDRVNHHATPDEVYQKFAQLLAICKEHGTALRIGVNHGSLSQRMLGQYGDTPQGMAESAMEYLRICVAEGFGNVIVSMKASNARVMVQATRLVVERMEAEDMHFPLHLGVTEAGEGEDGRIKSAVGIGSLLADGLGDTIRVSLTEEPQDEIPVARQLVACFADAAQAEPLRLKVNPEVFSPYEYRKRASHEASVAPIGGTHPVAVVANLSHLSLVGTKDIERLGFELKSGRWVGTPQSPDAIYLGLAEVDDIPIHGLHLISETSDEVFVCNTSYINDDFMRFLKDRPDNLLILQGSGLHSVGEQRAFFLKLQEHRVHNPVVVWRSYSEDNYEGLQLAAAAHLGALLLDGYADGVMLSMDIPAQIKEVGVMLAGGTPATVLRQASTKDLASTAFGILQASRVRVVKTEYIACPGCGRTLYNLQGTLQNIKQKTSMLKGLKIAVMGCIVNGPGEMADADYGYVGAGPGKISLYKGKECVQANLPQEQAVEALVDLIKRNGDWKEE